MSVPRRFNEPQGLANIDVLIEDDAPISLYFNVVEVPEVITQGKSSFLIGGSNLLKPQTEIKFEITNDDSGAVVYTEPVSGYLEGTSRRVSIEVYEDINLFGDATLTVVGELDPSKTDVPIDFQGVYNVRYTRKIYVSAAGVNTQPILFYQQPRMVVSEIVKPYITTTTPSGSAQQTGNVTGEPSPEELGNTTNTKQIEEPGKFLKKEKNTFRTKLFGGGGNNSFVRKGRRRARRSSPEGDKFTITKKAGSEFDAKLIGGELTIKNPQVDTSKFELKDFHEVPTSYKSDIENVKNAETLIPSTPFTIIDTRFDEDSPEREVIVPLANEGFEFTASFSPLPTQSISTVNFRSYADIRLSRLRTFSGDIDRVKVYARNKDAFGDFEMVSDQQIESPELLFNVFGAGNQRIGYFHSQDHINLYWSSGSNTSLTQDSQYVLNSVEVSGSNLGKDDFLLFQQTGSLPISYLKDTEYEISANILGFTGPKTNVDESISNQGLAAIFISGSGFENNHDFGSQLGFQLTNINNKPGFLKVTDGNIQDFGIINETFSPVRDGTGVLQFVVFGGRFYVSDVSITPATDTGFSPNFIQVIAPVPPLTQERPDDYEFLAEFYDVNNNIAETISFASASTFQGGNSYILGDDNVLSGSMYIGSSIGGGIEMAGVSSGFIRSIGYKGFTSGSAYPSQGPGFLLYSGSVLSNITDDYTNGGVGLELVGHSGSYFKFRTDPAELDIRTDAFFIGQEPLQFISGSTGNIEISSSLFHLDPKNNLLKIGADAVIDADLSVNNIFSPAGTNAQTALAAITSEGFAKFVSASIGAFKLNNDSLFSGPNDRPNFFISGSATGTDFFISSSNFQVRATGEVSASSLQLEGGSVGGLDVSEGTVSVGEILKLKDTGEITGSAVLLGDKSAAQYLQYIDNVLTVRGDITVDSITTPAVIAGSPSTVLNASASITSDGLATFKSGSIAGWKIFGSKLSGSNATLDADGAALYKSDQGPNTDSSAAFPQLRDEYYIDFTPEGGDSSGYYIKMGPNFGVDKDGILFASGATFQGSISASSGLIGGFTIGSSSLFSSDLFISGSPLEGGVDDPRYMFISTSKFNVKQNGDVTGSNAKFTGGSIGGWTINDTNFSSPGAGIRLNANGDNSEISINSHTFANEGIQLGYNGGNPRFYAGDGAQNFLRYDSSNGVSIKTTLFELDTPTLELSTTHASMSLGSSQEIIMRGNSNSPFIAIQPSVALQDKAYGEIGIMLAVAAGTTPLFSAVGSGGHIKFNGSSIDISTDTAVISGSNIQIVSPTFLLGSVSDGNFISGSNGNMSIESNNFELSASNIEISSTQASMSIGVTTSGGKAIVLDGESTSGKILVGSETNKQVEIFGNHAKGYIRTGKTSVGDTTEGFWFANNNANPEFHVGDSNNFIKLSSALLEITTTNLKLDTDSFDVDSAGGGSIALGTTPNTSIAGTNKGIFMSGSGDFLLFGNSSNFFKFDSTGNSIELKTDTFDLDASTLVMKSDSTGSIALGASPPSAFDSGTGFFVDGGGNLLLGSSSGNRVQYNATSGTITLKSQTFFLDASTIVIDSSVNSGKIAMGPVPPTAYNSGNGFYVDGTGKLLIGSGSGNHVQFDGSNIDIVAEAFFIGNANTQFMSGSNSNIEISSSLFHLDPANDALIIGADATINADLTVNNLRTPSTIGGSASTTLNASSSITSEGFARFVSASIGGFHVSDSHISSSGLLLRSNGQMTGSAVLIGDKGAGQFLQFVGSTLTVQGDITANTIRTPASIGGASSTDANASSSIDSQGFATFKSASIGGFVVDSTQINSSNDNLVLKSNGQITGSEVLFDGGTIGGWTVTANQLEANNIKINAASGYIEAGDLNNVSDYQDSSTGFFVNKDGEILLKAGTSANKNYMRFAGGTLDIKTNDFELDANNLELSSAEASMSLGEGKIKLVGASTSTITVGAANAIKLSDDGTDRFLVVGDKTSFSHFDQSTDGIIFGTDNGTAKFEIASDGDNYISFNGSGLDIKAETFDLATTKLVIDSGTNDGKIALGATPPTSLTTNKGFYADGTGKVLIGDADGNRISFDNTNLIMSASKFFLGSSAQFVSGSNGNIEISSSNFHLDAEGDVIMSGNISATTGEIGGFTIDSDEIKNAGNIALNSSTKALTINDSTFGNQGIQLEYNGGTPRMYVGDGSSEFFKFDGTNIDIRTQKANISGSEITLKAPDFFLGDLNNFISGSGGSLKIFSTGDTTLSGSSVTIATPQFFMGATGSAYVSGSEGNIEISSSKFFLKSDGTLNIGAGNLTTTTDGDVTMTGTITANAGTIGGFTIDADEIKSGTNISMNSSNKALTINSSTFGNQGIQLEYNSGTPRFYVGDGSNRHVKFDGTDVDIKTDTFLLDTTNLDIDSSTARIEVSDGSATRVRIGEVDSTAASHYGLVIFDGTGTAASDEIVHLSDAKNQIASWSLSPTQITSENLVIDSAGIIQTSDFASGVQGWRITSANNGEAEFEKVTVRGTLATTVFEKESVNAVGGQLYVANSTIISSSAQLSATATTMSVANVGGFVADEIISAKKISDTGFSTEYMLIESASRDEPSSDKNFAGKLYLVRGYSGSSPQDSGSLGDSAGTATTYENGQVIVSTGKIGTGFIRLNANPNDQTTPYIDIVERTGSAIYDVQLKARLGDLSGLSSGLLYGETNPGFGLFTENVFLSGAITAQTGSIEGILHVRTDLNNQIKIGTNVENSLDGIYINDNNFWYTNGHFKTGFDGDNFIHQSGSKLEIKSEDIDFQGSNFLLEADGSSGKFYLGTITSDSDTSGQGVFMDSGGHFRVIGNATNQLIVDGGSLTMKSDTFDLLTNTLHISSSQGGAIAMGSTIPTQLDDNGIFLSGSGEFNFQSDSNNLIRLDGSTLTLKSQTFSLTGTNLELSNDKFKMGTLDNATDVADSSTGFLVDSSGNVLIKQGGANAEYLQFNGGGIDIKAGTFDLATSTMVLDSGTNNGTISLGSTPNTSVAGTNTGFYVDGGGDVLLRADADNFIKMNIGSSPVLDMKAETFFMGGTAQFLSGSNGKLEISSSNFHLQPDGDTIMQGKITATSGEIAGLNIDSNKIYVGTGTHNNSNTAFYVEDDGKFSLKDKLSWDGSNLSIEGSITITGGSGFASPDAVSGSFASGDAVSGSVSQLSGSVATDVGGLVQGSSSMAATARLTNTGMEILNSDDNVIAVYSADATIGRTAAGQSNVLIDSDGSVDIRRGTEVSASFGTTTTIGPTSGHHVSIDSDSLDIKTNSTTHATFAATSVIGSSTDKVTINDSGITIRENNADTITMASGVVTIGSSTDKVTINGTSGITIRENNVDAISLASGAVTIRAANNDYLELDGTSIDIFRNNVSVVNLTDSAFTLGGTSNEHIIVDTDGLTIKDGGTVRGKFTAAGATIGNTSNAHVSASTFNVSIIQDANHKAVIDASGMTVTEGGNQVAQFAATSVIGSSTDKVTISDSGITIRENNADSITLSNGAVEIRAANNDYLEIDGTSIDIFRNNVSVVNLTDSAFTLGGTSNEHIIVDTDGLTIKDGGTVRGQFKSTGATIGNTSDAHISASTLDVSIIQDANHKAVIDASGMTVTEGGSQVAQFAATTVIGSSTDKVTISDSGGIVIRENNADSITLNNGAVEIRAANNDYLEIDGTSVDIFRNNVSVVNLTDSAFTLGGTSNEHIIVDTDGLTIKDGGTVRGQFTAVGATIGNTSNAHISASTLDVSIIQDANHKAVVNASGLTVTEGGNQVAQFAATSTIGSSTDKVTISDSGITIRENNSDQITMADNVITVGSSTDKVTINGTSGITIKENNKDNISLVDGTIKIGVDENDSTFVQIDSDSVDIIEDVSGTNTTVASFGLATTIGGTSGEHVKIDSSAVSIKTDANTTVLSASSAGLEMAGTVKASGGTIGGLNIGSDKLFVGTGNHNNDDTAFYVEDDGKFSLKDKLSWDGSNLSIEGSITITGGSGFASPDAVSGSFATPAGVSGSVDTLSGSVATDVGGLTAGSQSMATQVVLASDGMSLKNAGGTTLASYGTTVSLRGNGSTDDRLDIDADGVEIFEGGQLRSIFGQTTVLGSGGAAVTTTSTDDCIRIADGTVSIFQDNTHKSTVDSNGLKVFSGHATDTVAEFGSDTTITGGTITIRSSDNNNDKVVLTQDSFKVFDNNTDVASFGAITRIGDASNEHISMSSSGMTVKDGTTQRAVFAATSVIGSSTDKVAISDSGITIRENDVDTITMATGVVTIGSSTDQVEINGTSGITIRENDVDTIALSGGAVVIGEVGASKNNIQITSGAVNFRNNTTTKMEMTTAGGINIGSNFSVDTNGNLVLTGNITAPTGQIGEWDVLSNGQLLSAGTTGNAIHSASFEAGASATFMLQATNAVDNPFGVRKPNPRQQILQKIDQGVKCEISTKYMPDASGVNANTNRYMGDEISLGLDPENQISAIDGHTSVSGEEIYKKRFRYRDAFDDDVSEYFEFLVSSGSVINTLGGTQYDPYRGVTLRLVSNQHSFGDTDGNGLGSAAEHIRIGGMTNSFSSANNFTHKRFGVMAPTGSFGYLHLSSSQQDGGTSYYNTFHVGSDGIEVTVDGDYDFLFKDGGEFHADADILAFSTTTSDISLKDNIQTISGSLSKVMNLRGVEYVWNKGGRKGQKDLGVVAQEVEKVLPEIVRDKRLPLMDSSDKTYKTVDYERITAVLIEGMKEQQEQIDELRREVEELKNGSSR